MWERSWDPNLWPGGLRCWYPFLVWEMQEVSAPSAPSLGFFRGGDLDRSGPLRRDERRPRGGEAARAARGRDADGWHHHQGRGELGELKGEALLAAAQEPAYEQQRADRQPVRAAPLAVELEPEWADLQRNFGMALLVAGEIEEAEAACRKAVSLVPDDADNQVALARALAAAIREKALLRAELKRRPELRELSSASGGSSRSGEGPRRARAPGATPEPEKRGQQQRHDLNYSQRTHAEAIRSDAVWSVTFAAAMAPYASERIFEGAGSHIGAAVQTARRLGSHVRTT